jgi:phage tail-like protein
MANRVPPDPYKGFRFRVQIDGIQEMGFMECSSVGSHLEFVEYREGGDLINVRKLPGKASYPDITLKWGMTENQDLYKWHLDAVNGNIRRVTGSVIQLDDTGTPKLQWNFFNAWPSKWDSTAYNAKGNDVSIETLTLTCERVQLA